MASPEQCSSLDKSKQNLLDTLVCGFCKRSLNIPPIMSFRDGTTICGRCYDPLIYTSVPPSRHPIQNKPLESLVTMFPFACIYRNAGCNERNVTKHYLKHEASCRFGPFSCPMEECEWKGQVKDFTLHFQTNHGDNFLDSPELAIDTKTDRPQCFLLNFDNREILFQCKYNTETYRLMCICALLLNSFNTDKYKYELDFRRDVNAALVFTDNLNEINDEFVEDKCLQVDMDTVQGFLKEDLVHVTLKIVAKWQGKVDPNLLNELKCPVCLTWFMPTIFVCKNGHSVCENCKKHLTSCPICRAEYTSLVHNHNMERLIAEIVSPWLYA